MQSSFKIKTKSEYAALSEKETDVMYMVTDSNQVSSVEVNSKSIIEYVLVKFYDSEGNLIKVIRGRPNEKLVFPTIEPILDEDSNEPGMTFSSNAGWYKSATISLDNKLDSKVFPTNDASYYLDRQNLTIKDSCEIVLQGNTSQSQYVVEEIKIKFLSARVFLKETKFGMTTFVPILKYNYVTNENSISFQIINIVDEYLSPSGCELIFDLYADEKCETLIGKFPLTVKVTQSNESAGD